MMSTGNGSTSPRSRRVRRSRISALFAFFVFMFAGLEWYLMHRTNRGIADDNEIDHPHHGGVDGSFFLKDTSPKKKSVPKKRALEASNASAPSPPKKKSPASSAKKPPPKGAPKAVNASFSKRAPKKKALVANSQHNGSLVGKDALLKKKTTPKKDAKRASPPSFPPRAPAKGAPDAVNVPFPSHQEDELCGGCRSLEMEYLMRGLKKERCGALIYDTALQLGSTLVQAAQHVVHHLNHTDCLPCLHCDATARHYWRYDRAAPPLQAVTTHYFDSIPKDPHRIPQSLLRNPNHNLTQYFAQLNQQGKPPKPYLFEYNPSIVPLPDHVRIDLQDLPNIKQALYVASFRVATTQACFDTATTLEMIGGQWESPQRPEKKDYLGLALLRADLSVVAEVVVDLHGLFRKREDFRLFVLHQQLFVATYHKITPLWILYSKTAKKNADRRYPWDLETTVETKDAILLTQNSPLRVKLGNDFTKCGDEMKHHLYSKNLNYFVNSKNQTMVELNPLAPHIVRPLPHILNNTAATPNGTDDTTNTTTNFQLPPPSFFTSEELVLANEMGLFKYPLTEDRGGACCVEIVHPLTQQKLWLGVAHAKTPHHKMSKSLRGRQWVAPNQYLSRWYAFQQEQPYPVVAVSGFFCWGAGKDAAAARRNPLVPHSTPTKQWTLGTMVVDCPVIHFVTGMTEKVGDPDTLIVAYGVADCTSWFAEVKKADVVQLLFFGPKKSVKVANTPPKQKSAPKKMALHASNALIPMSPKSVPTKGVPGDTNSSFPFSIKRVQTKEALIAVNASFSSREEDELCGGCRSLEMEHLMRGLKKERCGALIYDTARKLGSSLVQAAHHVVHHLNYSDCLPCLHCTSTARHYWRYDQAAPPLHALTTHYFDSLPADPHRIPQSILQNHNLNLTQYFAQLNQQGNPPKAYLFEYNPSIVPLPDHVRIDLQDLPNIKQALYVASFRVATTQACFDTATTLEMIGGQWESPQRPEKKDYLGLALLRADLSVVAEVIVDLHGNFRRREDFRLFVLHQQLFVATYHKITPLWILHSKTAKNNAGRRYPWDLDTPVETKAAILLTQSSPLRVQIGTDFTKCGDELEHHRSSKNLNYFVNSKNQTMVELNPLAPHIVRHLPHILNNTAATPNGTDDSTNTTTNFQLPPPSFFTAEELVLANEMGLFKYPFSQDRGGACCVEIVHPLTQEKLWLGVGHAKTPYSNNKSLKGGRQWVAPNQYLSRWYAFQQEQPYPVVAVSGLFCWGAGKDAAAARRNPLVPHSAPTKQWTMGSMVLDCPVIHFVTGMTEKVGDPDMLIVAYGVADCTSWFAEVKKADVVQLLFFGPKGKLASMHEDQDLGKKHQF